MGRYSDEEIKAGEKYSLSLRDEIRKIQGKIDGTQIAKTSLQVATVCLSGAAFFGVLALGGAESLDVIYKGLEYGVLPAAAAAAMCYGGVKLAEKGEEKLEDELGNLRDERNALETLLGNRTPAPSDDGKQSWEDILGQTENIGEELGADK